ncbi:MAG: holo-ACP synthase [Leptospiraceae bacterium]|nr:holo-ACP synthase [Leptospiraceae bacterium]MCB1199832.1 holo-ACP synthase [Leptospiraceae bacterium]
MIVGLGTDICENQRIAQLYARYGERFLKRVFFPEEIQYCLVRKNPVPHLTARFALKEAFIKALGKNRDLTLSYRDVGIVGGEGKKNIIVKGELLSILEKTGAQNIHFSIAHENLFSSATVILEK